MIQFPLRSLLPAIVPILAALCAAATLQPGAAQAGVLTGPISNPATGNSYYLLESATWIHSQFEARQLGGNLATINDSAEDDWVIDNFRNFGGTARNLWIGLNDARTPDTFEWVSGDTAGYRGWAGGQPDNFFGGQIYVAITPAGFLRGDGWGDQPDGTSDFLGTPYHGVVEVEAGSGPPQRDPAFAFTNFDEPADGQGNYSPGPGASELGFSTQILAQGGATPTLGKATSSTTPTSPIFFHSSLSARTIFEPVDLLGWFDVSVTVDVAARLTTYEDGDRLRIFVRDSEDGEIDLFKLEGAELNQIAGLSYFPVSAEIPETWRQAQLVVETSTNSTQDAERIDIDNVAFRSPTPQGVPEIALFTAGRESVPDGAESSLSWLVFGADTVEIEADDFAHGVLSPDGGILPFIPVATGSYTIIAENAVGESRREVTIEVQEPLFGASTPLKGAGIGPISVHAADLDADGAVEVVIAAEESGEILLFANDSIGNFESATLVSDAAQTASSVQTADLDGDGDPDIISTSLGDRKLAWYENLGEASGQFGPQKIIDLGGLEMGGVDARAADLDGDGDQDLIAAFRNTNGGSDLFAWYENLGAGTFAGRRVLSDTLAGPGGVEVADLDGDGDPDILAGAAGADQVVWFENLGGTSFSAAQGIGSGASPHADSVLAADLDGDGDLDVLSAAHSQGEIRWFENLGAGNFSVAAVIVSGYDEASEVRVADLDNDGDLDVLSAALGGVNAAWYANYGGGEFSSQLVLFESAERGGSVFPADVDADGDLDVLFTAQDPDTVAWVENLRIVNQPPVLTAAPADQEIEEDSGMTEISLAGVITDPEDGSDGILYEIDAIANPALFASATIDTQRQILIVEPAANKNGSSQIDLRGSDRRGLGATTRFTVTATPVNDRPVASPIPPITANSAADPDSLIAGGFFSDVDVPEGDRLSFKIKSNSNPRIFSKLDIDPDSGALQIEYADFVSGEAELVIEAEDSELLAAESPLSVTLPELPEPLVAVGEGMRLNRQTGLFEQTVTITNSGERDLGGFRLDIAGLPIGAMLYNGSKSGADGETAAVEFGEIVSAGGELSFTLEYHVPSRRAPAPLEITSEVSLPATNNATGVGAFQIDRMLVLRGSREILIEFPTTPGQVYEVQYSADGQSWRAAQGKVRAAGNRVQWIDHGAPKTHLHPSQEPGGRRLYRVVEIGAEAPAPNP